MTVICRRRWLGAAGTAAIAAFVPGRIAAQTFTATSISQAAQQARREVGVLARRADNLLRQTVADGFDRGGAAVRRFRAEQAALMRELAAIFNGRVSEDDWLLVVPTRELDLVLTLQPMAIRIAPRAEDVETFLKEPLPVIEPRKSDEADDIVLAAALAALGQKGDDRNLRAELRGDASLAAPLTAATAALKAKRYGLAALEFERLMRVLVTPRNVGLISGQGGLDAARALYRALVVRFVPFVGWTLFVSGLLAALYQSRDSTAPQLR